MQNNDSPISDKKNRKTGFVIAALVFFIAMCAVTTWAVMSAVLDEIIPSQTEVSPFIPVQVDYAKDYPYDPSMEAETENTDAPGKSALASLPPFALFRRLTDFIDYHTSDTHPALPYYKQLYGIGHKLIGRGMVDDSEKDVILLDNGKLVYIEQWEVCEDSYEKITDFTDWLKERDTDFLFVFPISIADDEMIRFPKGLETGYGEAHQAITQHLTEHDVTFFDTKPYLLAEDPEFFNWVYRTDHHWTVRAGISVTEQMLQIMRDTYGYDVDPSVCDAAQYDSVVYPAAFDGSLGRKVTTGYSAPEDIEFLYPKFETRFHIEIPTLTFDKTDDFENALIDKSVIRVDDNAYGAFMYGDQPLIRIHNENCTNGVRVLMLKQSKANVITPYLACAVEYLDIIDPRHFHAGIRSFVDKTNPDIVILCSSGPSFESDDTFDFN